MPIAHNRRESNATVLFMVTSVWPPGDDVTDGSVTKRLEDGESLVSVSNGGRGMLSEVEASCVCNNLRERLALRSQ